MLVPHVSAGDALMPRRRMIDPDLWADRKLGQLSDGARLLFIGMFSNADDEGRLTGDPVDLKRLIFGFSKKTPEQVAAHLEELAPTCKHLLLYEIDGEKYAAFLKWPEYQYIQRPKASRIPPPIGYVPSNTSGVSASADTRNSNVSDQSQPSIIKRKGKERKRVEGKRGNADAGASGAAVKPPQPGVDLFREVFVSWSRKDFWPRFEAAYASVGPSLMKRRMEEWRDRPGCSPVNYSDIIDVVARGWIADGAPRNGNGHRPETDVDRESRANAERMRILDEALAQMEGHEHGETANERASGVDESLHVDLG